MAEHAVQRFERIDELVCNANATRNRQAEWQRSFLWARAISRKQHRHDFVSTALHLLWDLAGFITGQTIGVARGNIIDPFASTEAPWPN
jgi:hypothetical protein